MPQDVSPIITALSRKYGLDPQAVIAVARGEGGLANRPDDVGDLAGGGSYGPFQLYTKGALPAQYRGKPEAADSWAWSPQGIEYALSKMKEAGASGLSGEAAVNAIVRKFERPAKPDASVAAAVARLGSIGSGGAAPIPAPGEGRAPARTAQGTDPRQQVLLSLLQARRSGSHDRSPVLAALSQPSSTPTPAIPPAPSQTPATGPEQGRPRGGVDDAFYTPLGYSIDEGKRWDKTIGGHGNHGHVSFTDPQTARAILAEAQRRGLTIRENPAYDKVDPVHVKNSDHYSTFPGTNLGRAADISGNPKALLDYMRWVTSR